MPKNRPDLKELDVTKNLQELRKNFSDKLPYLKGDLPIAAIKIGQLKDLLCDDSGTIKYKDDEYFILFLAAYRKNNKEDRKRYGRKKEPNNTEPDPDKYKDIDDFPTLLMAVANTSHGLNVEFLLSKVYDASEICPPPTGACR